MNHVVRPSHNFIARILNAGFVGLLILCFFNACGTEPGADQKVVSIEEKILESTKRWTGTPYKMAVTTKERVDCSTFTKIVFKEVLEIDLP